MINLVLILAMAQGAPLQHPSSPRIVNCDGKGFTTYSSHGPGEEWFSMTGRVLDPEGNPVCGAWVVASYVGDASALGGANCFSGLHGEYFLDNIRKDTPFHVSVNPYFKAEWKALTAGINAVPGYVNACKNVRTGGLAPYASPELRLNQAKGVVTNDITLPADPEANGVVIGETGVPGPHFAESKAALVIPGRFRADLLMDGHGTFVVFGVPPGNAEVRAEIHAGGRVHTFTKPIIVPAGSASVTRVDLRAQK